MHRFQKNAVSYKHQRKRRLNRFPRNVGSTQFFALDMANLQLESSDGINEGSRSTAFYHVPVKDM